MTNSPNPDSIFQHALDEHIAVIQAMSAQRQVFERIAGEMTRSILQGKKVLWCGNGGSAADSQHFAAELMGRFRRERRGLPSIALTTDTSALTAIGNDYGYDKVFERQVEALCNIGDVLVGISTSGNSKNVCLALDAARKMGAFTVALTGEAGGAMSKIAESILRVPSKDTARIQEGHILCGHMLCDWVELSVCATEPTEVQPAVR
ncbi:MAG TPA: D-sedoheptulose 7-phosphate isomerase [Terracidiphilus sp.]|jgi:D-sedoheptulose 7-phosphate isomerase